MKIRIIFLFARCLLSCSWDIVPSIKSLFLPCEGDRPLFEVRLGNMQIVSYQMEKVAKVQKLIGSAWLRVLGMVVALPSSGMAKFLVFC